MKGAYLRWYWTFPLTLASMNLVLAAWAAFSPDWVPLTVQACCLAVNLINARFCYRRRTSWGRP